MADNDPAREAARVAHRTAPETGTAGDPHLSHDFPSLPHPYAASSVFQPIRSLGVQPRANPNAARLSSEGVEVFAR